MGPIKILNVKNIRIGELQDIVDFCDGNLRRGQGALLIPLNPIKVVKARSREDFQAIIDSAEYVFPDAWGIKWAAARLYGMDIPVTPGYQVMFSLLSYAESNGHGIYILGTTDEVLAIAATQLREKYPSLSILGMHNGFFSDQDEDVIFGEISALRPKFVFVAMGEYRQEVVANRIRAKYIDTPIFLGVGGSVDLIAGRQPKPPDWVRKNHWEWLYRLVRQPFRAPRFKALPIFVFLILKEAIFKKKI